MTSASQHATLDLTLIEENCDLEELLQDHPGLAVIDRVSLVPEHFMAQTLLPIIAGIYVYPTSAPLRVAHRRIDARSQSRVELAAGACLLRGGNARNQWTLAIPPLLAASAQLGDKTRLWSERTRKFALLADAGECISKLNYTFEVHRPRQPS